MMLLAAAVLTTVGCRAGERTTDSSPATPTDQTTQRTREQVERIYFIDPDEARDLGYRIDWQFPTFGRALRRLWVRYDSVYTLDERNFMTRIRREQGDRVWRLPVGGPLDEMLGIDVIPDRERIFVTAGSGVLVLDIDTGSQIQKQRLNKIASTAPVRFGQYLIYGSRTGQLAWHSYVLNSYWRGYQISNSIEVQPTLADDYVIAVGNDGRIMSIHAPSASQAWSFEALAPVVARPAASDGVTFVASLDQHLRAFDIDNDRAPLWEYLTESQLDDPPMVIGDRVYQQVETEGLVCFEAQPADAPGGIVVWRAADARGNVLTRLGADLIAWDAENKRLEVVDANLGALIKTIELPAVDTIQATSATDGELYATSPDGRVIRLVPR
jgi:outer membrane protein assembly factor BamB